MMSSKESRKRRRVGITTNNKSDDDDDDDDLLLPHLPPLLLSRHVFPFLDRTTWNLLARTCKELHQASQRLTPPWPQGVAFCVESAVYSVAFEPKSSLRTNGNGNTTSNSNTTTPLLAVSGAYGMLQVWNSQKGQVQRLEGHKTSGGVNAVSFSPDGRHLASAGDDRTVRVWTLQPQPQQQEATFVCTLVLKHPRTPHLGSKVQCVSFSPVDNNNDNNHGSTLASGSEDGRVRLWQTDTGTLLRIFRGFHRNSIMALTFSPSGDAVAFGGSDQTIRIKNLQDESRQCVETPHPINAIAFSPTISNASTHGNGRRSILAVGCRNSSTIRLFSTTPQDDDTTTTTTLTSIGHLEGHSSSVTSLVFLNDHSLISASEDSTIRQWDLRNMTCVSTQKSRASRCLLSIAISPDQTTLASGNITRNLSFWRL